MFGSTEIAVSAFSTAWPSGLSDQYMNSRAAFGCLAPVEIACVDSWIVVGDGTTYASGAPWLWSATSARGDDGVLIHFSPAAICWAPGFALETNDGFCAASFVRNPG